jgi:hypothetical protein
MVFKKMIKDRKRSTSSGNVQRKQKQRIRKQAWYTLITS